MLSCCWPGVSLCGVGGRGHWEGAVPAGHHGVGTIAVRADVGISAFSGEPAVPSVPRGADRPLLTVRCQAFSLPHCGAVGPLRR